MPCDKCDGTGYKHGAMLICGCKSMEERDGDVIISRPNRVPVAVNLKDLKKFFDVAAHLGLKCEGELKRITELLKD